MTPTMRDIIHAIATRLHETGVGYWPGPTGTYPQKLAIPPIFAKRLPPTPGRAIAINTYGTDLNPNPDMASILTVRIQVRSRAPMDADPTGDNAITALHGQHHQEWAGLIVDRCRHLSTAQLGADSAGLDERADNFEITIHTRS